MASGVSESNENPEGSSGVTWQDELAVGRAGDSNPLLIAVHGQSSIAYVVALVAGGGPSGMDSQCELLDTLFMSLTSHSPSIYPASCAQVQTLSTPYQPCYRTQNPDTALFETHSTSELNMLLLPSFKFARQAAASLHSPCRRLPCQCVRPTSAEVATAPKEQIQELRTLGQWLYHHDPTLPPPIVGGIESDHGGVADRYGVKGKSVLTAFVDIDELSCRVCGYEATTRELALLHQQQERHFQSG